jgi:hypothetical protein
MNLSRFVLLVLVLGKSYSSLAAQNAQAVSLCSIQKNPESFLHTRVEVDAVIFAGLEVDQLQEGKCLFRVAYGDDYQTFGNRFRVKHDSQWDLMRRLLKTPNKCRGNARLIKARMQGTVERVPPTGGTPESEMPLEFVITSVSQVQPAPIDCGSSNAERSGTLVDTAGHAAKPSPALILLVIHLSGLSHEETSLVP